MPRPLKSGISVHTIILSKDIYKNALKMLENIFSWISGKLLHLISSK
jgi:hypothetical protein